MSIRAYQEQREVVHMGLLQRMVSGRAQVEELAVLRRTVILNAGAARVVVPVREGFEPAIDHFMNTGNPWLCGELPDVTSEYYLPIVEEIKEQLGAPGDEVPRWDHWEVTVPTSLVIIRADGSLPRWKKDEEGKWVLDEGEGGGERCRHLWGTVEPR